MIYHRRCTNCGSTVKAKNAGGVVYCEDCVELDRIERRQKRILNARQAVEYTVVKDPTPVDKGGFAPGAQISHHELHCGLRAEYRAFTIGTILKAKSGEHFIILNKRLSNGLRLQKVTV